MELQVCEYLTASGISPVARWRRTLDPQVRMRLDTTIRRFAAGNFGDCKAIGGGVLESRVHSGPGYRIYFGLDGLALVVLLAAGNKSSQRADIEQAKLRWRDYNDRKERG